MLFAYRIFCNPSLSSKLFFLKTFFRKNGKKGPGTYVWSVEIPNFEPKKHWVFFLLMFSFVPFIHPILERRHTVLLLLLLLLLCMSPSGDPPWILKWAGLASSGQRPIFLNWPNIENSIFSAKKIFLRFLSFRNKSDFSWFFQIFYPRIRLDWRTVIKFCIPNTNKQREFFLADKIFV